MRPIGYLGLALIVIGAVVLAMRGISYTREREQVNVGPIELAAERKGFIPPWAGGAAIIIGAALIFAGRRQRS